MRVVTAIAVKTIRSAIRKKIAHLLLFFSALTAFVLPLTVKSDGTAKGLVQLSVTYTLGITGVLLSLTAVWLGATLMSEDVEGYQIHMVVTKPVSRFQLMCGKWLGVVVLLGCILAVSAVGIYYTCMYRLYRSDFSKAEFDQLNQEVLIGRHGHDPAPIDYDALAERELADRLALGAEMPKQMPREMILDTIKTQISKDTETVTFGQFRPWVFKGLPTDLGDGYVSLRYRAFVERAKKKDQRQIFGQWLIRMPEPEQGKIPYLPWPVQIQGGSFSELHIPAKLISPKGELEIRYVNLDRFGKEVVFQGADGPTVMVGSASFANNFVRVTLLLFLQMVFMATLGCAAGACLSTPMAVFISYSYIFMGLMVRYSVVSMEGAVEGKSGNLLFQVSDMVGDAVKAATFTINEYVQIGVLTDGRLVETPALAMAAVSMLFFRAIPIMALGLVCFYRREFGLVVRK